MSIRIKTEDTKFSTSTISINTALELYEGGLYKMIQEESAWINHTIKSNRENIKIGQQLLKRIEDAGIKTKTLED